MVTAVVIFDVDESKLEIAKSAIAKFVCEIDKNEVDTLTYISYQDAANPLHFTHFMEFRDETAHQAHRNSNHVREFTSVLYPCCLEPPNPSYLSTFARKGAMPK